MKPLIRKYSPVATIFVALTSSVFAASDTWTGATDATWATSTNWLGGSVPGAGNTATFNGAGNGNTTVNLGAGVTLSSLVFDTSSAAAYTIGSGAVGSQTLTIGAAGTAILMNSTVANDQLINANLAYGANAITLNNSSTTNTLTIAGNLTGSGALTKSGAGALALSGTNSPTGNLVFSAGRLNITGGTTNFGGAFSNIGSTASTTAVANISSGATFGWTGANGGNFGGASAASGVLYNSGTFNITGTTANSAGTYLGNAANTYGYLRNNAGATTTIAGRLWLAQASNAAGSVGLLDVQGGTVTVNGTNQNANTTLQINGDNNTHATSTSYAGINIVSGTLNVTKSAAQTNINTGQNEYTSINITGTGKWTTGASGTDNGIGLSVTNIATNTATLSIANGGTLETGYIYNNNALGTGVITFDNGTIRATFSNSTGLIQGTNTKTYIQSGGATVDTNGFNTTIQNPLLAPTGNGVDSITLGGTLTGYVGAPIVKITGGGGTGAAAIANFDPITGTVTGITITSKGSGYTSAPTITLVGGNGGATGAGVGTATATATIAAVTGGGLTKTGTGTLTLSGANTYTGATTISAGTLALASTGSIASTQISVASGATYNVSAVSGYTLGSGKTLTNNGTVNGSFTVASGATLNGSGTFSSAVTVNGNLNPGNSPGAQTYAAGLTLGAASVTTMEIAGLGGVAGTDHDFINVTGGTLTNDGLLAMVDFGGFDISAQTGVYNLFDFVAGAGDFDGVTVDGNALTFNVGTDDWSATVGDATYNFAESTGVLSVTVVPEPTAALLGGLGMLGLLRRRRVA